MTAQPAQDQVPRLALCERAANVAAHGAGRALAAEASAAPEWVQLLPRGPLIAGRDGRSFLLNDPAAVIAATLPHLPLVIDFEHAAEIGNAQPAPAAGWIEALEARDGGIWGRAAWTAKAAAMIAAREYRFLSPAFFHAKDASQTVTELTSAGLVHKPNFSMMALNRAATATEPAMLKEIFAALGLKETATAAEAVIAVNTLQTEKTVALSAAQNPPLEKYIPAAQHTETVKALNTANELLAKHAGEKKQAAAEALIGEAVKAGKIAPAARAEFLAMALNAYEGTKAAIAKMPAIIAAGEDDAARAASAAAAAATGGALTPDEKAMCAKMNLGEELYLASKKAQAAA